jgi:hypothetical protein
MTRPAPTQFTKVLAYALVGTWVVYFLVFPYTGLLDGSLGLWLLLVAAFTGTVASVLALTENRTFYKGSVLGAMVTLLLIYGAMWLREGMRFSDAMPAEGPVRLFGLVVLTRAQLISQFFKQGDLLNAFQMVYFELMPFMQLGLLGYWLTIRRHAGHQ